MGTDIFAHCEAKFGGKWTHVSLDPFLNTRNYGLFGFLADIRNISKVPALSQTSGLPADATQTTRDAYEYHNENGTCFGVSHLSLKELLDFDYDSTFEDRRITIDGNQGATAEIGEGQMVTYRDFLGPHYFQSLNDMEKAAIDRIIFWFE